MKNLHLYFASSTTGSDVEVQEVAMMSGPLLGGQWSPDLQVLVLATSEMIYLLSREFEIISEELINTDKQGKDQLLTVGWGSKESQFQGAGTRKKREAADLDRVPSSLLPYDDRAVKVSWRADAQFFTVSSIMHSNESDQSLESRRLHVWNRELELMSHCDWLSGIENVLAMRPQGNLIAVTRVFKDERFVWLYERNGQYRFKFSIGEAENMTVRNLMWNNDSSVLAIHLDSESSSEIQFYTVSNYEWMQKLAIKLPSKVVGTIWDPENPHCFHLHTESGHYRKVYLERMYDTDDMLVVNVSKNKLKITDFYVAPVPPPMSHYELELPHSILGLCQTSSLLVVLLSDLYMEIYQTEGRKYMHKKSVKPTNLSESDVLYNMQLKDDATISIVRKARHYEILEINLENGETSVVFSSEKHIIWHRYAGTELGYVFQTRDGDFCRNSSSEVAEPLVLDGRPIQLKSMNNHKCWLLSKKKIILSLTRNHQLFVNGNAIHSSIGSVSINDHFVIVTSLTNLLYCIPVKILSTIQLKDFDKLEGRVVERGAVVVASEPNGTRVWLQMPRGNLETVHPRALLIDKLRNILDQLEFGTALKEMRRHRVDMNLLMDHDPELLLKNVQQFVDQINDADLLNLFILSLYDEDSTTKIFAPYYQDRPSDRAKDEDKINKICDALMKYILSLEWLRLKKLYTAVLSCFVKKKPSQISEALADIRARYETVPSEGETLLREWLRHLSYLVDDRLLFNKALKTYDLHVALLVAEACDRDPKEYLALLRDLQEITPKAYQRYHIDLKLDPPDVVSALANIAEVEEKFDECVQHIKKYRLYSNALAVFKNKSRYQDICQLCAENLLTTKRYSEAALLFQKCGDLNEVLKCYNLSRNYKGYVGVAEKLGISDETRTKTLEMMALSYESTNDFADVAEIYRLISVEKHGSYIIENFCRALRWQQAWNISHLVVDSGPEQLQGEIEARRQNLLSMAVNWKSEINKHINRLEVVRENKIKQLQQWIETEGDLDIAQSETMSEASTTVSNLSRISKLSTVSSRRRKNIERKKKVLKEGSPYEDAAILSALKETYSAIMKQQDELKELLPVMVNLDMLDEARALQSEVLALFSFAIQSLKSAWPHYIQLRTLVGPLYEIYRGEDGIVRMPSEDSMPTRIPMDNEIIAPHFSLDPSWQMEILK